jgi:hypothetical protein
MISLLLLAAAATGAPEPVGCLRDERPLPNCTLVDTALPDGSHRLVFRAGAVTATFVGRGANGWWSGLLDGRPAMGYERNRGNIVFSTRDLQHNFAWWYPADEHGTY